MLPFHNAYQVSHYYADLLLVALISPLLSGADICNFFYVASSQHVSATTGERETGTAGCITIFLSHLVGACIPYGFVWAWEDNDCCRLHPAERYRQDLSGILKCSVDLSRRFQHAVRAARD